jgi:hypothetical protein
MIAGAAPESERNCEWRQTQGLAPGWRSATNLLEIGPYAEPGLLVDGCGGLASIAG